MGTQDPLVHIEAATLAGGDNNQDRYAYGDGWAFVLDGATSFSEAQPIHDGGWYADALKTALLSSLPTAGDRNPLSTILAAAIQEASSHHAPEMGACPTSTVALARWNARSIELYVLGDAFAVAWHRVSDPLVLNDDRIASVAEDIRESIYGRLRQGLGFDARHRSLLSALQTRQEELRNTRHGYWIAGDKPVAAYHGYTKHLDIQDATTLLLASDGFKSLDVDLLSLRQSLPRPIDQLHYFNLLESEDPDGMTYLRSKLHDDKTMIWLDFQDASLRRSSTQLQHEGSR